MKLLVWSGLAIAIAVLVVQGSTKIVFPGKVCRQVNDSVWTCRYKDQCTTKSIETFLKRNNTRPCGPKKGRLVCCQPENDDQPPGIKSRQKCNEYGKSVFKDVYNSILGTVVKENTCADSENLMLELYDAAEKEYPHQAYIGSGGKKFIYWNCGASLISERFLLGAAHCVGRGENKARWAKIGDYSPYTEEDEENFASEPVTIRIIRRYRHRRYINNSVHYDIALFQLRTDVTFNEFIRPTCLSTKNVLPSYAIATGWGFGTHWDGEYGDPLRKTNMTILPREIYEKEFLDLFGVHNGVGEAYIFTIPTSTPKDKCKGDSGGPLQVALDKPYCMYDLLGVSSKCKIVRDTAVVVYTKVYSHLKWIESIVWPFEQKKKSSQPK